MVCATRLTKISRNDGRPLVARRATAQAKIDPTHPEAAPPASISEQLAADRVQPNPATSRTSSPSTEREQRFRQVLSLHGQGWSYRRIADQVGLDRRTAPAASPAPPPSRSRPPPRRSACSIIS